MRAREIDHELHVILEEGDDPLAVVFPAPPTPAGRALVGLLLGRAAVTDPGLLLLGEERMQAAAEALRADELDRVVSIASQWAAFGGDQEQIDAYVEGRASAATRSREFRWPSGHTVTETTLEDMAPYGRGAQNSGGRFERYELPREYREAVQALGRPEKEDEEPAGVPMTDLWQHVLDEWHGDVLADMRQTYALDIRQADDEPWWYTRALVLGLAGTRSRLSSWISETAKGGG